MSFIVNENRGVTQTISAVGIMRTLAAEGAWAFAKRVAEAAIYGIYDRFDAYFDIQENSSTDEESVGSEDLS